MQPEETGTTLRARGKAGKAIGTRSDRGNREQEAENEAGSDGMPTSGYVCHSVASTGKRCGIGGGRERVCVQSAGLIAPPERTADRSIGAKGIRQGVVGDRLLRRCRRCCRRRRFVGRCRSAARRTSRWPLRRPLTCLNVVRALREPSRSRSAGRTASARRSGEVAGAMSIAAVDLRGPTAGAGSERALGRDDAEEAEETEPASADHWTAQSTRRQLECRDGQMCRVSVAAGQWTRVTP